MMKQGLGNALDRVIRKVFSDEVIAEQRYKGREGESCTDI